MRGPRKTDKSKLKEGRGTKDGDTYCPWLKVHEFGSTGRCHRLLGWKSKRIHQLLSDLELYFFLDVQWEDNIVDIREQYPLLPLQQTIDIADNLNIKHPAFRNKRENELVMTTDFILTVNYDGSYKDIARTIKPRSFLDKKRVVQKFLLEKEYFRIKGIDWGIVTEESINITKARNIYYIYNCYFWNTDNNISGDSVYELFYVFKKTLFKNNLSILNSCCEFESLMNWEKGEGLNFFKFLLVRKFIITDMNVVFNFNNMKINFYD